MKEDYRAYEDRISADPDQRRPGDFGGKAGSPGHTHSREPGLGGARPES